jgi:eukaryotic-like serine/threonine-protein kinase
VSGDGRARRADDLFEAALDLPGGERARRLRARCAGDAELLAEVEELLAAHEVGSGIQEADLGPLSEKATPEQQRRRMGPYQVLREIGRGGMGVG